MEIFKNWKELKPEKEFYASFLPQVSAPVWHGRNLDALGDSIVTGDVNGIEPPYTIRSINELDVTKSLEEFKIKVLAVFKEATEAGRDINVIKT